MKHPYPPSPQRVLVMAAALLAVSGATLGLAAAGERTGKRTSPGQPSSKGAVFRERFQLKTWPEVVESIAPGEVTNAPVRPGPPATSPATLPGMEKVQDDRLFELSLVDSDIKTALSALATQYSLNIVPDNDVSGKVTLNVKGVPLDVMMRALLEAHDYHWEQSGGLIRVFAKKTRTFQIDYLRLKRSGTGMSSANLASGMGGGGGGMGGGGMGGGGGAAGGAGMGGGMGGGMSANGSAISLSADNPVDFWKELKDEIRSLLTPQGRESLAINMTAGLIQVTDRPSALKQVEDYLNGLRQTVTRQVDIEARLYDVTLNDQFQFGVDWSQAVKMYGSALTVGAAPTVAAPIGGFPLGSDSFSMVFQNANTSVILKALQEQGEVRVISKPRLRTLNNQTALIKVGTEVPFFQRSANIIPASGQVAGTAAVVNTDQVSIITVGTILAITPQISSDDWISLDISPVLTSLVESRLAPKGETIAPVIDIKQASTLIRVQDGSTVVLGGLIQTSEARKQRRTPGASDIPLLGRLFTGRFDALQKRELVILITPRIVK